MNPKQSTHAAFLAFLCFLGAAAGSAVASYAVQPDPIPQMPPSPPQPVIDPTPAVMEVLEELRRLRSEWSAGAAQRSPAGESSKTPTPELLARLEQLAAALESKAGTAGPSEFLPELAKRTPAHEKNRLLPEAVGANTIDIDVRARAKALTNQHLLWTARDIVAEYGMPDEAHGLQGSLWLTYRIESSRYKIQFGLTDGLVTYVNVTS